MLIQFTMQAGVVEECFGSEFNVRQLESYNGNLEENRKRVGAEIQDWNRANVKLSGPVFFNLFLLTVK